MPFVACEAEESLDLIAFSFLDEEDPDFALKLSPLVEAMATDEIVRRFDEIKKRIIARCLFLLEVVEHPSEDGSL